MYRGASLFGVRNVWYGVLLHTHYRFHMAVLKSPELPRQCINSQELRNSRTGQEGSDEGF